MARIDMPQAEGGREQPTKRTGSSPAKVLSLGVGVTCSIPVAFARREPWSHEAATFRKGGDVAEGGRADGRLCRGGEFVWLRRVISEEHYLERWR